MKMRRYFGVFLRLVEPVAIPNDDLNAWALIPTAMFMEPDDAEDWGEAFVKSAETKMEFKVHPVSVDLRFWP